jgi:NADH:ubiquinone oxidoreductase subunit 4 (subunit M)
MTPRLIALALALLLLLTQQLGLQHLLSHGLSNAALVAVAATSAHTAHTAASDATATDATADGLCQACLALVVLGTATLPALLRWATRVLRSAAPAAPVVRAVRRGAGAPYLARAPPLRA